MQYKSRNCDSEVLILSVTWISLMLDCSKMLEFCMKTAARSTPLVQDQCEHTCEHQCFNLRVDVLSHHSRKDVFVLGLKHHCAVCDTSG